MRNAPFTVILLLLLLPANANGEISWGVRKGDQYSYEATFTGNYDEIKSGDSFKIEVGASPPERVELLDEYLLLYEQNSLSEFLENYIRYFVVPISVVTIEGEVDYISYIEEFLEESGNISVDYAENGVISNFRFLENRVVTFQLTLTEKVLLNLNLTFPMISMFIIYYYLTKRRK